jgi:exportin-1
MSGDEATFRRDRSYINKLNTILVGVLKQEWPQRWPTFVPDLVAAAKSSETLCENCMHILKARAQPAPPPMER